MSLAGDLLGAFECHQHGEIRAILAKGLDPVKKIKGKLPVEHLIEMYLRSDQFAECLRVMLKAGASIPNPALQAVLLDDDRALARLLRANPRIALQKMQLPCTFTSLKGASLLHVCAEYNRTRCAKVLLKAGLDVNVRAAVDPECLNGHTPIFHAVNQHRNYCRPMLELLVDAGADLEIRLQGLVWGGGFEWETVLYDVTPMSYTQCGLLRQFQRTEEDVYANIEYLHLRRYGAAPKIRNVPNRYLRS